MYIIPCQFTLKHNIFVNAFHGEYNNLFEHGHYTHCCHRVCANCLPRFIKERKKYNKCPNVNNIVYSKKCVEILGLWNCRGFEIDSILQFHEVLEGCRKFTKFKSDLVVQCVISKSSSLYSNTLQRLNLPKNIELHLSYSSIPNNSASKGNEPYWKL